MKTQPAIGKSKEGSQISRRETKRLQLLRDQEAYLVDLRLKEWIGLEAMRWTKD